MILKIENLKEQTVIIYYNREDYLKLPQDSQGNFVVTFDSSNIFYTSTNFKEIKECRTVWCFMNAKKCFYEEDELIDIGFKINEVSSFTSDSTSTVGYRNPHDIIIIEKIR